MMIDFKNIDLKFNERVLFDGFNLSIKENEKVLFVAASGKGKTTLVKMLLGFIVPDRGEIFVNGLLLSKENLMAIRKEIAYISQDADIPKGRVADVFEEVFHFHVNRHIDYKKEMLEKYLAEFLLEPESMTKEVDSLSGGERQRLAFIMGILLDRKIWILDEITTGLDLKLKTKIMDRLFSFEKTMLIVSHDEIYHNRGLREVRW